MYTRVCIAKGCSRAKTPEPQGPETDPTGPVLRPFSVFQACEAVQEACEPCVHVWLICYTDFRSYSLKVPIILYSDSSLKLPGMLDYSNVHCSLQQPTQPLTKWTPPSSGAFREWQLELRRPLKRKRDVKYVYRCRFVFLTSSRLYTTNESQHSQQNEVLGNSSFQFITLRGIRAGRFPPAITGLTLTSF